MFSNKRKCSFNSDWEKQYNFVKKSRKGNGFFYCTFCQKDINVESMGVSAIKSHMEYKEHKQIKEERRKSTTIENFVRSKSTLNSIDLQVATAEGTFAYHVCNHHQSFASTNCSSTLYKEVFLDSEIAKRYGSAQKKTAAIIKGVLSPFSMELMKNELGEQPFSLCIDASNHGEKKLVPIVIRFFNGKLGLRTRLLDMTSLPGETADQLFDWICSSMEKHQLDFKNLISFSKRQNIIPIGCSAHILHNAAKRGAEQLQFDIESVVYKLTSYFKGSTQRHTEFHEICDQYETTFVPLPTHSPTRWTTLSKVVSRMLEKWHQLKKLFAMPNKPRVLDEFFQSENSEPICYFLQNILKTFDEPILALQKSNLMLPDLISIMEQFRAKIEVRLHGTGNFGRPFFGGHFALRRASPELEIDFCNFYKIVLEYIDRWFQLQLLPKNISWTNLQKHPLNYAEVVHLAEQICPEIAQLDELFDEVSAVNQTLAGISEEFWLKSAEDKWKGIFEADGATEAYTNLYRSSVQLFRFRHPTHSWNEFFHWQAVNGPKKEIHWKLNQSKRSYW